MCGAFLREHGRRVRRALIHQQTQRMGQHRQDSLKRGDGPTRGAWQVHDQGLPQKAAHTTTQDGERSLPATFGAHLLAKPVKQAVADGSGGFRSNVTRS